MAPRGGEGQPKQKAKPKVVDTKKTEHPIDLGIGKATASLQKAAKSISKSPVASPGLTTPQRQTLLQAKNPALARAAQRATQQKTKQIIRTQKPNILNAAHLIGADVPTAIHNFQHPLSLLSGPPAPALIDPNHFQVNSGMVIPGGGSIRALGRIVGRGAGEAAIAPVLPAMSAEEQALRQSAIDVANRIASPRRLSPEEALATGSPFEPSLLKQQAKLNTAHKSAQASAYDNAINQGLSHSEGRSAQAFDSERIPLPADINPNWSKDQVQQLHDIIQNHPTLDTFAKGAAKDTVNDIARGVVPQKARTRILIKSMGTGIDRIDNVVSRGVASSVGHLGLDALGLRKALMSAFDFSHTLRQGLIAGMYDFRTFKEVMGPQLRSMMSEPQYRAFEQEVLNHPLIDKQLQGGMRIEDLGTKDLNLRNEASPSPLAERIPLVGRGVRGSGRAFTVAGNKGRQYIFNNIYTKHHDAGLLDNLDPANNLPRDPNNEDWYLKSLGEFANNANGTANLKRLGVHRATANRIFWSPALLGSRANLFNPLYYYHLHPLVRAEAYKALFRFAAGMGAVIGAAKLAGARVDLNPRASDFGKIQLPGGTKIDPLAGVSQLVVFGTRLGTNSYIDSKGQKHTLGSGFGTRTGTDIITGFGRSKLDPTLGMGLDVINRKDMVGNPITVQGELAGSLPLTAQDVFGVAGQGQTPAQDIQNTFSQHDPGKIAEGLGLGLVSAFGTGVQNYSPRNTGATTKQKFLKQANDVKGELNIPKSALDEAAKEADIKGQYRSAIASAGGKGHSVQKLKNLLSVYKDVTGHDLPNYPSVAVMTKSEADANAWLDAVKGEFSGLTANYDAWNAAIQQLEDAKLGK